MLPPDILRMICAHIDSFRDLYSFLCASRESRRLLFEWLETGEVVVSEGAALAFLLRRCAPRRLFLAGDLGVVRSPGVRASRLELVAAGPDRPTLALEIGEGVGDRGALCFGDRGALCFRDLELVACRIAQPGATIAFVDCAIWGALSVDGAAVALVRCCVEWCSADGAPRVAAARALTLDGTAVRPLAPQHPWQSAAPVELAGGRVNARDCVFDGARFSGACVFDGCTFVPARAPITVDPGAAPRPRVRARGSNYGHLRLRRYHFAVGAAKLSIG
jgi:hypothetical protein